MGEITYVNIVVNDYFLPQRFEHSIAELLSATTASYLNAPLYALAVRPAFISSVVQGSKSRPAAVNTILRELPHGYTLFLNAGDTLHLEQLSHLLGAMNAAGSGHALSGTEYSHTRSTSEEYTPNRLKSFSELLPAAELLHCPPDLSGVVFRRPISLESTDFFDEEFGWEIAQQSFFFKHLWQAHTKIHSNILPVKRGKIYEAGGAQGVATAVRKNYGAGAGRQPADIYSRRILPVSAEELISFTAQYPTQLRHLPFVRLLNKVLNKLEDHAPSLLAKLSGILERSESAGFPQFKWIRDLALGIRGIPTAVRALSYLSYSYVDPSCLLRVPIFINNYNRLDMMVDLLSHLEAAGFRKITILDNESDYPPLLDFYRSTKHKVVHLGENIGPLALWTFRGGSLVPRGFYLYSDSDVVPSFSPGISFLRRALFGFVLHPYARKIGLALRIDNLPEHYGRRSDVIAHESQFWSRPLTGGFFDAPVDTTFALYSPGTKGGYWIRGIRLAGAYVAEHRPWYENDNSLSDNERYYRTKANHWASWNQADAYRSKNNDTPKI